MQSAGNSTNNLSDSQFRTISGALAKYHEDHGVTMRPYVDESLPLFSKLPEEFKSLIIHALSENLALFEEMSGEKERLDDSARLLWRALKRIGWSPTSDLFDKIEDGDVIEVYNTDRQQIFRNLNFFRYISMTLEETISVPLGEAVTFDPSVIAYIESMVEKMNVNGLRQTEVSELEPYIFQENWGSKWTVEVTQKWVSPVFMDKKCVAVVCINRSKVLSQ